jgi:drug/metabolite transporter (DMT)-like permease
MQKSSSPLRAGLDPLLASCLWGGMYVVSRASFAAVPPITLGALRVLVGGVTLAVALRVVEGRDGRQMGWADGRGMPRPYEAPRSGGRSALPGNLTVWRRADTLRALVLGILVSATIVTQFLGTELASAHDGALLTTVTPVFVVPLAWLLLGERPRLRIVGGMLLALAGVALVVAAQSSGSSPGTHGVPLLGDALLLASALAWALFTVVGAPLIRRFSALAAATAATLWSIPILVPLAALELALRPGGPWLTFSWGALGSVLYLGWGATALAWLLWYRGLAKLDAGVAAIYFFAQPVVGGLLAGLLLHETLSPGFWLGGAVLAAGILLVSWSPRTRNQRSG